MAEFASRKELILESDKRNQRDQRIAAAFTRKKGESDTKLADRDILWNVSTFSFVLPPSTRAVIFPPESEKEN